MDRFKRNLLAVYSANAVNGILSIVVVPLSVACLGSARYGLFSIYSVLALYITLIDCGVTKDLTRLLASTNDEDKKLGYIRIALGFYLSISCVLLILSPLLLHWITLYVFPMPRIYLSSLRWIVIFAFVEYILGIPSALIGTYTIAHQQFRRYAKFNVLSGISRYLLQIMGVLIFSSPVIAVALMASRKFLDLYWAKRFMLAIPSKAWLPCFKLNALFAMLRHSVILSLSQLFQITVVAIGSVLINRHLGMTSLGIYRAAFDLANRIWFFSNSLGLVLFPNFSQQLTSEKGRTRLYGLMLPVLNSSFACYSVLATLGIALAPFVLPLIKLNQPGVVPLFTLLLLGLCLNAHTKTGYEFIQATGHYRWVLSLTCLALGSMLASFYRLFPQLNLLAMGWAWIISQLVFAFLCDALVLQYAQYTISKRFMNILMKLGYLIPALIMLFIIINPYNFLASLALIGISILLAWFSLNIPSYNFIE